MFSSPEVLLRYVWKSAIADLTHNCVLQLVYNDEAHLLTAFDLSFYHYLISTESALLVPTSPHRSHTIYSARFLHYKPYQQGDWGAQQPHPL